MSAMTAMPSNVQLAGAQFAPAQPGAQPAGAQPSGQFYMGNLMYVLPGQVPAQQAPAEAKEEDPKRSAAGTCKVDPIGTVQISVDLVDKGNTCVVKAVDRLGATYVATLDVNTLQDGIIFRSSVQLKPEAVFDMIEALIEGKRGALRVDEAVAVKATPGSELEAHGDRFLRFKFTVAQDPASNLGLEGCFYAAEQPQDSITRLEGVIRTLISRLDALEAKRA